MDQFEVTVKVRGSENKVLHYSDDVTVSKVMQDAGYSAQNYAFTFNGARVRSTDIIDCDGYLVAEKQVVGS